MKTLRSAAAAFFASLLVIICGCSSSRTDVPLSDGWSYCEAGKDELPDQAAHKKFIPLLPHNLQHLSALVPGKEGYIWLRNDFILPPELQNKLLSVFLGRISCADETYINGIFIGSTGRFPPNFYNEWNSFRCYSINSSSVKKGENRLLVKVYVNAEGALFGIPSIGESSQTERMTGYYDFFYTTVNAVASVLFFVFGLYHLYMFTRRREERENLYYGLMGLSFAVFFSNFFITCMPGYISSGFHYIWYQKIFISAQIFGSCMFALFIKEFLHQKDRRIARYFLYLCTAAPLLIVIFIPNGNYSLFYNATPVIQIFMIYILGYPIFFIIRGLKRRITEAKKILIGTGPLFIAAAGDIIHRAFFPDSSIPNFLPFGVPLFFIIMVVILANRFMDSRRQVEELNTTLEKKVDERTHQLKQANEEIEAAMEETAAINESLIAANKELEHARRIAERDMKMAVNLQQSLYPKAPETDRWDIAVLFKPMSGVSGDLYDFFTDGNGTLTGVGLFDVSGHGIASGLITMLAKTVIAREFIRHPDRRLSQNMAAINDSLISQIGGIDNYLTGLVLKFTSDTTEYVNAGHTDLLCRRNESGKVSIVNGRNRDIRGGFLGIDQMRDPFTALSFKVHSGDTLLMFTDCLDESKNPEGEQYGIDRIINSFSNIPNVQAAEDLDIIMQSFYEFTGTDKLADDLTVILMRKK